MRAALQNQSSGLDEWESIYPYKISKKLSKAQATLWTASNCKDNTEIYWPGTGISKSS